MKDKPGTLENMTDRTCANCAHCGCKMKFPSWHMDYCGKIDGPSCDTLMNRDDYCGEWEPLPEPSNEG